MNVKMMKTAKLNAAIAAADNEHWHYRELFEDRTEAQAEDRSMSCDAGYCDDAIKGFYEKAVKAFDRAMALHVEVARRTTLSNHARLSEAAMRGDVPA